MVSLHRLIVGVLIITILLFQDFQAQAHDPVSNSDIGLRFAQQRGDETQSVAQLGQARTESFPRGMTGYGRMSARGARGHLKYLRRATERAAVRYVRGGMEHPTQYNRAYTAFHNFENRYYSNEGPGGIALQRWLTSQSIYTRGTWGTR